MLLLNGEVIDPATYWMLGDRLLSTAVAGSKIVK